MKTSKLVQACHKLPAIEKRIGSVLVLAAVFMIGIFAFTAFTIDIGYIVLTKAQLQTAADASALAAVNDLVDGWGTGATLDTYDVETLGRASAVFVASANPAADKNAVYIDADRDVRFGNRTVDANTGVVTDTWGLAPYNMVEVTASRGLSSVTGGSGGDGPLNLFFGPVIGHYTADVTAVAVCGLVPGNGFSIESGSSQTADLLPFALDEDSWNDLLAGVGNDDYHYDNSTGTVTPGSDGILEVDLYPTSDASLPPGNRGTVDFGSSNNSTADIARQIVYGLNDSDLSYFSGEITATPTNPLIVNGDTGISAGMKDELESIIGLPRAIPLFSTVTGPGNNAMYTLVKFVGVRIVAVQLTGENKYVMIEPATFVSGTVTRTENRVLEADSILAPGGILR